MIEIVNINDILVEDRMRKDLGEIDQLVNSIKKYSLMQPIVLGLTDDSKPKLIAGERRLTALKRIGLKELVHSTHFLWRGEPVENEDQRLRWKAMELEENLKRKELSWQEQLHGKAQLLEIMQGIYGTPKSGPVSSLDAKPGFGIGRLAAMLGESSATTSLDLQVSALIKAIPALAQARNKSEILSKMKVAGGIIGLEAIAVANKFAQDASTAPRPTQFVTLHEVDFRDQDIETIFIPDASVDLIWSDLPYGADVHAAHDKSEIYTQFDDSRDSLLTMLSAIATESYRVLRNDRYAVFCFGFNYYPELVSTLRQAGFHVNPVPCIWNKKTKFGVNPLVAYCIGYEPLLVAWKGNAKFVRPGQSNVFEIPPPENRLHLVQKPVELVKQFLTDMTIEGSVVVDWTAGTCTTGVACHEMKRYAILFERNPAMTILGKARLGALK